MAAGLTDHPGLAYSSTRSVIAMPVDPYFPLPVVYGDNMFVGVFQCFPFQQRKLLYIPLTPPGYHLTQSHSLTAFGATSV